MVAASRPKKQNERFWSRGNHVFVKAFQAQLTRVRSQKQPLMIVVVSMQIIPYYGLSLEHRIQEDDFVLGDELGDDLGPGPKDSDIRMKA